ncbi:MAG: hypothetical protein JKY96_04915 [Phycisphaerales bacterium]|nr:hypothetical protein [Phycisphaerales bacterium]
MPLKALLIIALILLTASTSLLAQTATPPVVVKLDRNTTTIQSLGLTLYLPEGATAETVSYGSESSTAIIFPGDTGLMTIKGQKTTNPDLTSAMVADNIIDRLTIGRSTRVIGELLSRTQIKIKFWAGERFYIRQLDANGGEDRITGYTIFQNKPRTFLVFELRTDTADFENSKAMFETSVGTLDLGNPDAENTRRSAAISTTLAFMDSLTIADYRSVLTGKNKDHWERLYTPAATGDEMDATEHGYRRVRSWAGYKGEMTDKAKSDWSEDDRTLGYLFQLDAMAIETNLRIDTRAMFFVSDDQTDEAWTIRMSLIEELPAVGNSVSAEQRKVNSSITGARHNTSMTIYLQQNDQPPVVTRPLIEGEGYISQVQTYLQTALLASKHLPGQYASYAYNSGVNAVSIRWDSVDQPAESPGLWRVTSKATESTPATVSLFNEENKLLRVELANGRIWEPIELNRLLKLWKKKGLPLE